MRGLLDDDHLDGPYEVGIAVRPQRIALLVAANDVARALSTIREQCQVWGGATAPFIPLAEDGYVEAAYQRLLPGAAVDRVRGLKRRDLSQTRHCRPEPVASQHLFLGSQFAPALLEFKRQELYAGLEIVELGDEDPWKPIYAACLGLLPLKPSPALLQACRLSPELRFEDILSVDRVRTTGSLDDLLERLASVERITPRQLSMVHLEYGDTVKTFGGRPCTIPTRGSAGDAAGPDVIVLCSPGSLEDGALLWNLRAAKGDTHLLPIGLPVGDESQTMIEKLAQHPWIAPSGSAPPYVFVTSASLDTEQVSQLVRPLLQGKSRPSIAVASSSELLTLGNPGAWRREAVLTWQNGHPRLTPLPAENEPKAAMRVSDLTRMAYDITVVSQPLPRADDVRIDTWNETFVAGCRTISQQSISGCARTREIEWPSTSLMSRAIAHHRGLDLVESPPGRACRILLSGMGDLSSISYLRHAPLLLLLERMAMRRGSNWAKRRDRQRGREDADPSTMIAPTTDDLPEESFEAFKKALGNHSHATKSWLRWAEQAGLIIKGFPLWCAKCHAQQWIPVAGFSPPIICQGCATAMDTPFGDHESVAFKYRLSERLRRVYEHDAVGHLLVAHYFDAMLGRKGNYLTGLHPGMGVRPTGSADQIGEADILMLTKDAEFIPVEVKRTERGLTDEETLKLDTLVKAFKSPWSAVVACEYLKDAKTDSLTTAYSRPPNGAYGRMALTYEPLTRPHPSLDSYLRPFRTASSVRRGNQAAGNLVRY